MNRLTRVVSSVAVGVAIAPWLGGAFAQAGSSKPAPAAGDDRATSYSGNVTTCQDIGLGDATQLGDSGSGGVDQDGFVVDSHDGGTLLDVTDIPADTQILALVVKGGDGFNLYDADVFTGLPDTPVTDLHAPLVGQDKNIPTISHWFLCYGPADGNPPPPDVQPDASIQGDCDSATITLDAGSEDTDFTISREGDAEPTTDSVAAGQEDTVNVDLDADHPSVSVTAGDEELASFTRDGGCDETPPPPPPGTANPTVSSSNACRSGISVVLGNMDGTAPVTFTVTAPDSSVEHVKVRPDQLVRRHYAVAEDTTGVVTVDAPGIAEKVFSYHKNCTQVLGEKTVKTPRTPEVSGTSDRLPFTGSPIQALTALAVALLALGSGAVLAGRVRGRHAR